MGQLEDIPTGRSEIRLVGARPTPRTIVIEEATAPRPERPDRPGSDTRRLVMDGVSFVHQRLRGSALAGPPAALLQHFPAETGAWNPTGHARTPGGRELILMEHLKTGAETQTDEPDLDRLARESLDFIDALGLAEVDLLGFSLGRRPPEDVVLLSPRLVARLVSASHRAR